MGIESMEFEKDKVPQPTPEEQEFIDKLLEKTGGDREAARKLLENAVCEMHEELTGGLSELEEHYTEIATREKELTGPENPWDAYLKDDPRLLEGGIALNAFLSPYTIFGGGSVMIGGGGSVESVLTGLGVTFLPTIGGAVLEAGNAGIKRIRGALHEMRERSRARLEHAAE